jgi:hypothetical protein
MSFSLRVGGVSSAMIGPLFLDLKSLFLLNISGRAYSFSRVERVPVSGGPKQDFAVAAQQCWNGFEESAVNMLSGVDVAVVNRAG